MHRSVVVATVVVLAFYCYYYTISTTDFATSTTRTGLRSNWT